MRVQTKTRARFKSVKDVQVLAILFRVWRNVGKNVYFFMRQDEEVMMARTDGPSL